jgi:hypothetical protein
MPEVGCVGENKHELAPTGCGAMRTGGGLIQTFLRNRRESRLSRTVFDAFQKFSDPHAQVRTKRIDDFQFNPFCCLVVQAGERPSIDACFDRYVADLQLALTQQPTQVALDHG